MTRGWIAVAAAAMVLTACTGDAPSPSGSSGLAAPLLTSAAASVRPSSLAAQSPLASHPLSPASSQPSRSEAVTIVGSGDVLIHPPLWQQAAADAKTEGRTGYDFGPMYAAIRPVTEAADLATCEMETPLAPPEGPFVGWPNFNAPPQVLTALKGVGYDSCTTASNHTLDQGFEGVKRTLDLLDAAGLQHTGSARSAAEAATPLIITTRSGVKIAQLAFSFGFNGIPVPADRPWLANLTSVPAVLQAAHAARGAGADVVVLSLHWGTEYQHDPTAEQLSQARTFLASPDVDVILGDHVHVVQPFEKIDGKWVAYGMGNQISRHADPVNESREGVMPRFTFTRGADGLWRMSKAEAIPTWMQIKPVLRLIDLPAALASDATSAADRAIFQAAYDRISGYLNSRGAVKQGLTIVQ